MTSNSRAHWVVFGLGMQLIFVGPALAADVYKATAKFTNAEGKRVSTPVTISLEQPTSESDRAALVEKVRTRPEAAKGVLAGLKQLGYIEAVERVCHPVRLVQPGGDGDFITVS